MSKTDTPTTVPLDGTVRPAAEARHAAAAKASGLWPAVSHNPEAFEKFAALLEAAERERCAKKPLNFDQLQRVMEKHFGGRELTDDEADSAEAFARAVERAHGIEA